MTDPHHKWRMQRHWRIRRIKRFLRPLPRRANIHRYPVLKWFPKTLHKRSYLWSFKVASAVPALYAGWIITLLPIFGIQSPLAIGAALLLRANLPILIAFQLLSNPFTVGLIWYINYLVGEPVVNTFWPEPLDIDISKLQSIDELDLDFKKFVRLFMTISIGGLCIGLLCGLISSAIYRFIAYRGHYNPPPNNDASQSK